MSDAFNKDRLYAENQDLKDRITVADNYIEQQDKRITELVKRTAKVELAFAILESHNLEQQVIGIQDFSTALVTKLLVFSKSSVCLFEEKYIKQLREQATGGVK